VDEIRVLGRPANRSRQPEMTVEEPVSVEAGAASERQPREKPPERGRDVFRPGGGWQMREELIGAEIHARPALAAVITDDRETHGLPLVSARSL
jgi:hypothetical protein